MRTRLFFAGLAAAVGFTAVVPAVASASNTRVHYVDCSGGSDADHGLSPRKAWRSLTKANRANLRPGDKLLLKRGCTWDGQRLEASWHGTAAAPVTIGTYGQGPKPEIWNGKNQGIKVTGSHQVIKALVVDFEPTNVLACGQPIGHYYGVNFTDGAHNNTLTKSVIRHAAAGVHLGRDSRANRIIDNLIEENNVAESWTDKPWLDLGVWGISIVSDDNEIAYNTFRDNKAVCINRGYKRRSNSVEIYEGSRNHIHHNRSYGDRVFSESGSSNVIAEDNVYAYNLHVSAHPDARFVTTRGPEDRYGPVRGTLVAHNTIVLTGEGSQGVVCGGGCHSGILTVSSNIIWAEEKTLYANGDAVHERNVHWASDGDPRIQVPSTTDRAPGSRAASQQVAAATGSVLANPRFVAFGDNFNLAADSPALGLGVRFPAFDDGVDLAGRALPAGSPDAGAQERR